jgi:hypothetical protein
MERDDGIIIAVDGKGPDGERVTPLTVDPRALIRLADRFLSAMERVAKERDVDFSLAPGLVIVDKCGGVGMYGDTQTLRYLAEVTLGEMAKERPGKAFRDANDAVAALPGEQYATVHAGGWDAKIDRPPPPVYIYSERTERDVTVGGVHQGTKECSVEFVDGATGQTFTLKCDLVTSTTAARIYPGEALIEADVSVEMGTHKIKGGRLIQIEPLKRDWSADEMIDWMKSEFDPGRKLDS